MRFSQLRLNQKTLFIYLIILLMLSGCSFDINHIEQDRFNISYAVLKNNIDVTNIELNQLKFTPYNNEVINFKGNTIQVVFKLLPISNIPITQKKVIVLGPKYYDYVRYISENSLDYSKEIETMFQLKPTNNRLFSSENFVFNYNNNSVNNHFLVINENSKYSPSINLIDKEAYIHYDRQFVVFFTFMFSILIGLFLLNFVYFLYIKTKAYLYYSIYVFTAAITFFLEESRIIDYPYLDFAFLGISSRLFFFILSNIVVLFFIYEFLKLNWKKQRTGKLILGLAIYFSLLLIIVTVGQLINSPAAIVNAIYNYTIQLSNLIVLAVAYYHYTRGNRQAGFLLFSWVVLIVISSLRVYFVLFSETNNFWIIHSYEIGLIAGSIILGMGLADQTLRFKKSRDKAQAKFYKANKALFAETLVNNFLHEMKDGIYKEKHVENFIKHIENHFAQMILKYASIKNIAKLSINSGVFQNIVITQEDSRDHFDKFISENKQLINQACKNVEPLVINHENQKPGFGTVQIILIPVSLNYDADKADFEFLILEVKNGKLLNDIEIIDLQVFIEKSISALMDSQQLQQITNHAKDIISQAADKDKKMRLKDRFFANVSHEFRTPLTLTIAPLKDLHEKKELLDSDGRYLVDTALSNAQDLMELVDNILDIQKLEANKFPLKVTKVNLNNLIDKIIKKLLNWSLDNSQTLVFDNTSKQDFYLYCDKKEIEKVIVNIVSNAIKYSGNGSKIIISITSEDDWLKIHCLDDGMGIADDIQNRIFERYFQGNSIQHLSQAGTGLGLSYVKDVMELHHGKVTLKSNPVDGTNFSLWFKKGFEHFDYDEMRDSEEKSMIKVGHHKVNNVIKIEDGKIDKEENSKDMTTLLIVEDNAELLKFLVYKFKDYYKIIDAQNGTIGLEKANKYLPDLIISDVMMPEMNGVEMLLAMRKIKQLNTIPVILLTALSDNVDAIEGLEKGADDYVTKPFDFNELKARVDRLIASKKAIREENLAQRVENKPVVKSAFHEKLDTAINKNISDKNLNVERLAQMLYLDRSGLYRKIKAEFNLTPIAYIRKVRMEFASMLLKEKKLSVSETAYACGFDSLSYFSKQFKKTYGISPSEI